jgi:hypothetical protein
MLGVQTSETRRAAAKLARRAKRTSRRAKAAAADLAETTRRSVREASQTALKSFRKRPIAWSSAAIGAATLAGLVVTRRSG